MRWFLRLFRRFTRPGHNPDDVVQERWEADFSRQRKVRFIEGEDRNYTARLSGGRFGLHLKNPNCFAWVESAYYRYRDFVLEGRIEFGPENGYSAAGFMFRYANDLNYYYFLVSNRRFFRADVVFNGNPRNLIPWTPCPGIERDRNWLRIIARDTRYVFCINDSWVAEIEDDTIDTGYIAFAAQNYGESEAADFFLSHIILDSLSIHVEAQYFRWREYFPVDPERRKALAEALYSRGQYSAALVQLRAAAKTGSMSRDDVELLTECLIGTGLYDEALEAAEAALNRDPGNRNFIRMKADLLYSLNRFAELKEFLETGVPENSGDALLLNLYGNVQYALGLIGGAAESYEAAVEADPESPMYRMNAARARERLSEKNTSFRHYIEASKLLFREGDYEELGRILPVLGELDKNDPHYRALKGKMFFQEEQYGPASEVFLSLIREGYEESGVFYLQALVEMMNGRDDAAKKMIERALDLEDNYYLFWFKYGELLFKLGEDPADAVEKALELAPGDPWVKNLKGMILLSADEPARAAALFGEALETEPDAVPLIINYSEALARYGEEERALEALPEAESSEIFNHRGNLLTRMGRFEEAAENYEKGRLLDPDNADLLLNSAAAYMELDLFSRADEMLSMLLEKDPTGEVFNLVGNLSWMKGEHRRAEMAYRKGLECEVHPVELVLNCAELLMTMGRYTEAEDLLAEYPEAGESGRRKRLTKAVRGKTRTCFTCAGCGREWWAPKEIPEAGNFTIVGELPEESPAGECPECGKIFCIHCALKKMENGRFRCLDCSVPLKLRDEHLKYIVSRFTEGGDSSGGAELS